MVCVTERKMVYICSSLERNYWRFFSSCSEWMVLSSQILCYASHYSVFIISQISSSDVIIDSCRSLVLILANSIVQFSYEFWNYWNIWYFTSKNVAWCPSKSISWYYHRIIFWSSFFTWLKNILFFFKPLSFIAWKPFCLLHIPFYL